jgi:TolB-like protein
MLRSSPLLVLTALLLLAPARAAAPLRVAVLEFDNATKDKDLDALGKGLQSMFTTDLATLQTLEVVERARLKDVQAELKLARGKGFDKASASKLGKLSGATHLFVGSYTVLGEQMRLDGRLLEVSSGKVLLAEQMGGEKALFFELEQKLVQKVIAALGVAVLPKEKAQLARPHTADFAALRKFSEGIQAFDEGRLEEAMKALSEAKSIDADFKLASLTLSEYERLSAEVRAKAEVAGKVEDELQRLEKNKALAAEVTVTKKLWQLLDRTNGQTAGDKLRRVAILCSLSKHYADELGFHSRGPITGEDLAQAGFDKFTLERTADTLFKRAWSEGPDVFPKLPPLCIGLHGPSSSSELPIEELLNYYIKDAQKISEDREVLLSYMSNSSYVDPAVARLQLDAPGEVKLWEQLYALAEKLPGLTDQERNRFEQKLAELRRAVGDFDGSTQMYAAASRHTQDSYQLKNNAKDIDTNKKLKQLVGTKLTPLREYFLLHPSLYESDLVRLAKAEAKDELAKKVARARDVDREHRAHVFLLSDVALFPMRGPTYCTLRSGPRASRYRASELHYAQRAPREPKERPEPPQILAGALRTSVPEVSVTVDSSPPPAGFDEYAPDMPGGAEVGVAFALKRLMPEGGIVRGAPAVLVGYAVVVAHDKVRLVQIVRDGEHRVQLKPLAESKVSARPGKRALSVSVAANQLKVTLDAESVTLPYKPAPGDADGFVGFLFNGPGHAAISDARIQLGAR